MRFLADECVDREVVERLRTAGHEVKYVPESCSTADLRCGDASMYEVKYVPESCPGASDEEILGLANSLNALLLTADKDFGYMVFRLGKIARGVILLRLAGLDQGKKAFLVTDVIGRHGRELDGAFTVVTQKAVRIRKGQ